MISRRCVLALMAPGRALASPCCAPVSPGGLRLAAFLDGSGVDHLWLPGFKVNWESGEAVSTWEDGGPHTHCSAFVASAAMRLGVYVLRPPEHSAVLLANAQMAWLGSAEAEGKGWQVLPHVIAAQTRANAGDLVLAAYENPDPHRPGHIAIVRPGEIDTACLLAQGPFVTQAGGHNALAVPLARGFGNHRGAWISGGGGRVRFFMHPIDWTTV